jgi:hypothetical protein
LHLHHTAINIPGIKEKKGIQNQFSLGKLQSVQKAVLLPMRITMDGQMHP